LTLATDSAASCPNHSLATWLPWITLLVLAVCVYLARVTMRALVGAGLGVAVALSGSRTRPWCLTSGFKRPPHTR